MRADTVDKLIWVLVYGGLLAVCLGLALQATDSGLGWVFIGGGVLVAAVGALLVWVRSRMADDPPESP